MAKKFTQLVTETAWHIIIGGVRGTKYLASVELHNFLTGEQCYLKDLPEAFAYHAGAVFEEKHIVCGGNSGTARDTCYEFFTQTNAWLRVIPFIISELVMCDLNSSQIVRFKQISSLLQFYDGAMERRTTERR